MSMFDFTTVAFDLQGAFAGAVVAMLAVVLKIVFFGIAVQFVYLFAPRYLRPLVPLIALLLLAAYPAPLSRAADAFLSRAGLLPQAGAFTPAGIVPAATAGIATQVQATLDNFVAFLTSQLGL